jgi:hypothetical protein
MNGISLAQISVVLISHFASLKIETPILRAEIDQLPSISTQIVVTGSDQPIWAKVPEFEAHASLKVFASLRHKLLLCQKTPKCTSAINIGFTQRRARDLLI